MIVGCVEVLFLGLLSIELLLDLLGELLALRIQLVPPIVAVNAILKLDAFEEEEVEELAPHEVAILLAGGELHGLRELILRLIGESLHELRVLRKLLHKVSLRDVRHSLELGIVVS